MGVTAARSFIASHAALFRLSPAAVQNLQLLADNSMAASQGHANHLLPTFGGLPTALDGDDHRRCGQRQRSVRFLVRSGR